uniref:Uncharacterized protein n=1 Tax=Oncorhynchus tshawytscha TaxID=74940 RepID=A0A8C8FHN5_ONCTS
VHRVLPHLFLFCLKSVLHNIAPENVKVTLQRGRAMYFVLLVKYLEGKNHQMTINNFLYTIDVQYLSKSQ